MRIRKSMARKIKISGAFICFGIAAALDPFTPLGIAEWLIDIALVSIATIRGGPLEMVVVAAVMVA